VRLCSAAPCRSAPGASSRLGWLASEAQSQRLPVPDPESSLPPSTTQHHSRPRLSCLPLLCSVSLLLLHLTPRSGPESLVYFPNLFLFVSLPSSIVGEPDLPLSPCIQVAQIRLAYALARTRSRARPAQRGLTRPCLDVIGRRTLASKYGPGTSGSGRRRHRSISAPAK
jgi:hypothetical protein